MTRSRIATMVAAAMVASLCFSSVSRAEDCFVDIGVNASSNPIAQLQKTRPGSFLSALPGGVFVVTVAYIGSSPEDAFGRGKPKNCGAVRFRIDTLRVKNDLGSVEVELGERQELAPGETSRIVYAMDQQNGADLPTYEMDLMGFRFRSEPTSPRCSLVATGLFFADPVASAPIPFALIPSVGPEPKGNLQCGQ